MAVPTVTTLIDDATRADGLVTAGAGSTIWGGGVQGTQGLRVISNRIGVTTNGFNGVTAASYGPAIDLIIQVPVAMTAGSYEAIFWALAGAGTSSFSGMALVPIQGSPNDTWQIRRYTAGANAATPGSGTVATLVAGDWIWVNSTGSVHTAYVARSATPTTWTQVCTATDATYNRAGPWGFELGDTTQRIDNISGGTIGGAVSLSRTSTDSVTVSDAVVRSLATARTSADTTSVSDSSAGVQGTSRTATESVTATDAATRSTGRARTASDTTTVSDSTSRTLGAARQSTDTTSVSDAATRSRASSRSTTDAVTVTDAATRGALAWARAATDTSTVSDAAVVSGSTSSLSRTTSDTVTFSDAAQRAAIVRTRTAADSTTVTDVGTRTLTAARTASEPASTVTDASVRGLVGRPRSASETWTCTDSAARAAYSRTRAAGDLILIVDAATGSFSGLVTAVGVIESSTTAASSEGRGTVIQYEGAAKALALIE